MILARTGLRDPPILTPSICLHILPLKGKDVFRQVSKINLFKDLFVNVFVVSFQYKDVLQ